AGGRDAARLADEVFARALAGVPKIRARTAAIEAGGTPDAGDEARNLIARSVESDAEAIASVLQLAPNDRALAAKVEALVDQLSGVWLVLTGKLSEQRKGNRISFTLESKEQAPKEQTKEKPRNPKDAVRQDAARPRSLESQRVPVRKVAGPMNIY